MRMADSNSSCISGIIRPGNCWQVEPLAHHVAYLLFASSPIPGHSQLHRTGSVLSDRDSPLRQHKNRNTARLRDCDCRCHILAEEEFLDGCLCWQVLGDDRAEPLIDLLQALGIGKCLRRQDRVAHKQTQIIALRCNNCIAQSAKARVNTQYTSFVHTRLFSLFALSAASSPAQLSFTHTHPRALTDDQMVKHLDLQ